VGERGLDDERMRAVGLGVSVALGIVAAAVGVPLLLLNLGDGAPSHTTAFVLGPSGAGLRW